VVSETWAELYLRRTVVSTTHDTLVLFEPVEPGWVERELKSNDIALAVGTLIRVPSSAVMPEYDFVVVDSEGHTDAVGQRVRCYEGDWTSADPREWGTLAAILNDKDEEIQRGL